MEAAPKVPIARENVGYPLGMPVKASWVRDRLGVECSWMLAPQKVCTLHSSGSTIRDR